MLSRNVALRWCSMSEMMCASVALSPAVGARSRSLASVRKGGAMFVVLQIVCDEERAICACSGRGVSCRLW